MRLFLFAIGLLLSSRAHADYNSAMQEITRNNEIAQQAARKAERQAAIPLRNTGIMNFLARASARHGGYAYGPTITNADEDGYILAVSFGTKNGWECKIDGIDLYCANVRLNRKFLAQHWREDRKNLTVSGWSLTDLESAAMFLGYGTPPLVRKLRARH